MGKRRRKMDRGEFGHFKVHEAAECWPQMGADAYLRLVDNIKAVGLIDPIVLAKDGTIVDGRSRYLACRDAGIQPQYEDLPNTVRTDEEVAAYVEGKNARKDYTKAQRAISRMLTSEFLARVKTAKEEAKARRKESGGDKKSKSVEQRVAQPITKRNPQTRDTAAAYAGVSHETYRQLEIVRDEGPDLWNRLYTGNLTSIRGAYNKTIVSIHSGDNPRLDDKAPRRTGPKRAPTPMGIARVILHLTIKLNNAQKVGADIEALLAERIKEIHPDHIAAFLESSVELVSMWSRMVQLLRSVARTADKRPTLELVGADQ
jgi:ParB-like chromosome segregation protein Spo0J